jgi:two-component system sensor histidine kinase UhpB
MPKPVQTDIALAFRMPLRHLLIKRLITWLGLWLILSLILVFLMGQRDVRREYESAQSMVGDLHRTLMQVEPLSQGDLAAIQASLAQGKANLEQVETRRELMVVGLMLLLMAAGSGAVVWYSLRPVLNKPLSQLVIWLKEYEAGIREPDGLKKAVPQLQVKELAEITDSVNQLIHTLEAEQKRSSELLRHVLQVQEKERQLIAQDLHDHFGQLLTSIAVNSAFLIKRTEGPTQECAIAVNEQSQQMMHWLRGSLRELKPHLLLEVSLRDAALDLMENWARRSGWFVDFAWSDSVLQLPESHSVGIFRILQEALTNAARHSQAKRVEVLAGLDNTHNEFVMVVNNDGLSVHNQTMRITPSLGLTGLRERAQSLGGQTQWRIKGERFELTCRIPLPLDWTPLTEKA